MIGLFAVTAFASEAVEMVKIDENLYVVTTAGEFSGNITFLITDDGVLAVDTGISREYGEAALAELKKIAEKPVKYLVLTHYHADHWGGLEAFGGDFTLIAHNNLKRNIQNLKRVKQAAYTKTLEQLNKSFLKAPKQDRAELRKKITMYEAAIAEVKRPFPALPMLTTSTSLSLRMGGELIKIEFPGASHTDDALIVKFVDREAIHIGDYVLDDIHLLISAGDRANTAEWIRYLEKVETEGWKHIIPGHGRPGGRELIAKEIKYLRFLRSAVEKGIAAGKSAEEILNDLNVDEFKAYTWPGSLKTSILTIYNEMKTE